MTGRHGIEAESDCTVGECGELDLLVAAQARVGCPAGGVLVHEVLDHVLVEPLAEVPDVERDAEPVGHAPGQHVAGFERFERLGGELEFETSPGNGSKFWFSLPFKNGRGFLTLVQ